MLKIIDVEDIKNAKYLKFYVEDGFIYCVDIVTDEKVIVGESNFSRESRE
jgi:hypothetical protein